MISNEENYSLKNYWNKSSNIKVHAPFQQSEEDPVISRENVINKTGDGSITPKTHKHETSAYLDESKSTFVTEYAYANEKEDGNLQSHVVRFGINVKHDIEITENMEETTSQSQNQSVASSNFSKIKKYKLDKDNIQFQEQEGTVLKKAIEYLQKNPSKNSVIVDIFERQFQLEEKKINIEKVDVNKLETHSVVILRSNDTKKFIVVDPTTTTFSWVLGTKDLIKNIELIVPQKSCTIYKAPNKTNVGKEVDQWRDCIDIAVKLSFLFNARSAVYEAPDNLKNFTIADWDEVKLVSNQGKVETDYFCKTNAPVRDKQKSDIKLMDNFKSTLKSYKNYYDSIIIKLKNIFSREKVNELQIAEYLTKEIDKKENIEDIKNALDIKINKLVDKTTVLLQGFHANTDEVQSMGDI